MTGAGGPDGEVARRDLEAVGGLLGAQALEVAQHEGDAQGVGQCLQGGVQGFHALLAVDGHAGLVAGGVHRAHDLEPGVGLGGALLRAPVVAHHVDRNAVQPGAKGRAAVEAGDAQEGLHKGLLDQLLAEVGVAGEGADVQVDALEVVLVELGPGVHLAGRGALDQLEGLLGGADGRRVRGGAGAFGRAVGGDGSKM